MGALSGVSASVGAKSSSAGQQTRVIRPATFQEISDHLTSLGAGNQVDNLKSLSGFSNYYRVSLSRDDFMNLVFMANDEVRPIVPSNDRRLGAVAARAVAAGPKKLSPNWDLGAIAQRSKEKGPAFPAIVLRDARGSETDNGAKFYIQDGSHRSLGLAMAMLRDGLPYQPVTAFIATSKPLS